MKKMKNGINQINIIIIKILWIESNANYIKSIFNIFDLSKDLIKDDPNGNKLYEIIEKLIKNETINIKFIVKDKNPEHTREVNECIYILLASLYLNVAQDQIILTNSMDPLENLKKKEVEINEYNDN